jgi:hypothetical protein
MKQYADTHILKKEASIDAISTVAVLIASKKKKYLSLDTARSSGDDKPRKPAPAQNLVAEGCFCDA